MLYTLLTILVLIIISIASYYLVIHGKAYGISGTHPWMRDRNASNHYRNGEFKNLEHTPQLSSDTNMVKVLWRFLFKRTEGKKPKRPFTFSKVNLHDIPINQNVYVWLGHSSYYMQLDGKRILVDPVLCGFAAPFSFSTKAFKGSDVYKIEDIPDIDLLIITHDHWDHLDYRTVSALQAKVKKVVTGLGTDAHLYHWGYTKHQVQAMDWYESIELFDNFTISATPARHFSGRTFKRNQCLWCSFVIQSPSLQLFVGGDSGYGSHFSAIQNKYGAMDIAILELGQYHSDWPYIHMNPEEHIQALQDLNAKVGIPVHNSKFALSSHAWYTPMETLSNLIATANVAIWTPSIGEQILLDQKNKTTFWWESYTKNND